jgi:RNA polymerase sigma-70 factor (ECF subfamily)
MVNLPIWETKIGMTPPLRAVEDSALIEMILAGQSECFTLLMDRHVAAVRRRIRSMVRSAADLDDLLQEVLLKVWLHLSTFRAESSFRTWMTRVAINEALQAHRRDQCGPPRSQELRDLDTLASPVESPYRSLARTEEIHAVRTAVMKLPAKYKQVLILRDLDQFNTLETAQSLQVSIPAVKTRLVRARLMLLRGLQRSRTLGLASLGRKAG